MADLLWGDTGTGEASPWDCGLQLQPEDMTSISRLRLGNPFLLCLQTAQVEVLAHLGLGGG